MTSTRVLPRIGVAVLITREDQVLLIRRKGSHGEGTWSTPGGHLEFGETPEHCAVREVREEVGVAVGQIRFVAATNDVFQAAGKHYVTLWVAAASVAGEPAVVADQEVSEGGWFGWDSLPSPLFMPFENLLNGQSYPADGLAKIAVARSWPPR